MQNENLQQAMRAAGRTPTWLAHRMGMSRRTFFNRLKQGFLTHEQADLAHLLNVDPAWLFAEVNDTVSETTAVKEVAWTSR